MNETAIDALKSAYSNAIDNAYRYAAAGSGLPSVPYGIVKQITDLRQALLALGVPASELSDKYDPTSKM